MLQSSSPLFASFGIGIVGIVVFVDIQGNSTHPFYSSSEIWCTRKRLLIQCIRNVFRPFHVFNCLTHLIMDSIHLFNSSYNGFNSFFFSIYTQYSTMTKQKQVFGVFGDFKFGMKLNCSRRWCHYPTNNREKALVYLNHYRSFHELSL